MITTMSRLGDRSPWQDWSLGSEDFGYSATRAGASVPSVSTRPGWVVPPMLATLTSTAGMTRMMAFLSLIGTGGSLDNLISEDRTDAVAAESWEGLFERIGKQTTADAADVLTGADLIAEIKATLGLSITHLASMAGVSRQAVYDWIDGGQVSDANYDRLLELRRVCMDWRSLTNRPIGRLLRAKTAEGRSLLDLLREDPLDRSLIQLHLEALAKRVAEEEAQREARKARLTPLSEKDCYENALTHVIPASHS
jgi:transcriptional regulator with XRE-family HTH domain